jgi:hypothetical protein
MHGSASHREAKAELEAILSSGLFAHAPSLAQFLSYIGSKSLEGHSNQIKEYNIAVEALGRPPDFDQKKDSIVRVEAHRLRKRLRQYYESEGSDRVLRILIPPGQYVPQFVYREDASLGAADGETGEGVEPADSLNGNSQITPAEAPAAGESDLPSRRSLKNLGWLGGALLILAVALAAWQFAPQGRQVARAVTKSENSDLPPVPAGEGTDVRILAGSSTQKYVDRFGSVWSGDRFFSGGAIFSTPAGYRIANTRDPAIFQARREGTFKYDIPLQPGSYELHLYFAETLFGEGNIAGGGETYRIFSILANGKPLAQDLDVIADAPSSNTADVKVYKDVSPAADGVLHLTFLPSVKEKPFINAIEILPGIPGRMRPVRIVARDTSVNSKDGRLWSADRYFTGGQPVLRADPIKGTPDPDLYMGERFGNFSYTIPVVRPGHYTATLRFSESWFGAKKPAGGGAGERVFDVYCNGVVLLRKFDIFKEAGGEDRALDKVFASIEPNAQGKLVFSFVPVRNYACVNAIEVVDEGR